MKHKLLFVLLVLMSMAVGNMTLVSCGDDEVEPNGGGNSGQNAEKNTTDVAVTGAVEEVWDICARINGVVNLQIISGSYMNVQIGVDVSESQEFTNKTRTQTKEVVGGKRSFNVFVTHLKPETQYYYRTYVIVSSLYTYYGETYSFNTTSLSMDSPGHYVDLGLPSGTLWAISNIGAIYPEKYGDYFAWGETSGYSNGKIDFDWSTYKWCNGSSSTLTKYCTNSSRGTVDNKTELDLEDDAAYVNWGKQWRMPSMEQFKELINSDYTTTEWTTENRVYGRKITSKTNGNYIFLPAAGYRSGTSLNGAGSRGDYWSRTLVTDIPNFAWGLYFSSDYVDTNYRSRYYGQSVRPVRLSE